MAKELPDQDLWESKNHEVISGTIKLFLSWRPLIYKLELNFDGLLEETRSPQGNLTEIFCIRVALPTPSVILRENSRNTPILRRLPIAKHNQYS